jgi:hypothetical protein
LWVFGAQRTTFADLCAVPSTARVVGVFQGQGGDDGCVGRAASDDNICTGVQRGVDLFLPARATI